MMTYSFDFLPFFAGFSGVVSSVSSALGLGLTSVSGSTGLLERRPGRGESFMISTTDGSYIAVGPAYSLALILCFCKRFFAVSGVIPSRFAISFSVRPSIHSISASIAQSIIFLKCGNITIHTYSNILEKYHIFPAFGKITIDYFPKSGKIEVWNANTVPAGEKVSLTESSTASLYRLMKESPGRSYGLPGGFSRQPAPEEP